MNLVRYLDIDPRYKHLVTTDIMLAKQGCRRCHGRGHVGYNLKRNTHIPCGCVMVDMEKLAEVMKIASARAEQLKNIPTNIPSLLDPSTEAPRGNEP